MALKYSQALCSVSEFLCQQIVKLYCMDGERREGIL